MEICLMTCYLLNDEISSEINKLQEILAPYDIQLLLISHNASENLNVPCIKIPYNFMGFDDEFVLKENRTIYDYKTLLNIDKLFNPCIEGYSEENSRNGLLIAHEILSEIVDLFKPSISFLWGNSHPHNIILMKILEDKSIPIFIFERGLLASTLMIEKEGIGGETVLNTDHAVWRNWESNNDLTYFNKIRNYYVKKNIRENTQNNFITLAELREKFDLNNKKVIVYWGQHDVWSGLIPRNTKTSKIDSPYLSSNKDAILKILKSIQSNNEIFFIYKPHPHYKNQEELEYLTRENFVILNDVENFTLFDVADCFAFMNTTMQFESLFYEKPILLLANSHLTSKGIAYQFDGTNLSEQINNAFAKVDFKNKIINSRKFLNGLAADFLYGYKQDNPFVKGTNDFADIILKNSLKIRQTADINVLLEMLGNSISLKRKSKAIANFDTSTNENDDITQFKTMIRLIALYLPQFHRIPENDKWWGEGFTEWTNVKKAKPMFDGHYQPHVPSGLGYYDLRSDEVRVKQAELASEYGINGFCYYYYWFNGKKLLESPIEKLLESGKPDFPFCICWANENWTKRWDGHEEEIIMPQNHNFEDDKEFINELIPFFKDKRYITINGKPLLIIYRTELFPDMKKTSRIWREEAIKAGIKDLFLVRVESFTKDYDPEEIGFDAAMEFAPDWYMIGPPMEEFQKNGQTKELRVHDYEIVKKNMIDTKVPNYKKFRCVTPSWDNVARRKNKGTVFINSNPDSYAEWLTDILMKTELTFHGQEKLLFINAWNEWGEGCHLEPDVKNSRAFLEATRRSITEHNSKMNYELSIRQSNEFDLNAKQQLIIVRDLIEESSFTEAEFLLNKLFNFYPGNEYLINLSAEIEIRKGNLFLAEITLHNILKNNPSHIKANINLTEIFRLRKALKGQKTCAEQFISNQLDKAEELIEKKNYTMAKHSLLEILNLEPNNVPALNDLSVISILQKEYTDAVLLIDMVFDLEPHNEIALENRNYIENILQSEGHSKELGNGVNSQTNLDDNLEFTMNQESDFNERFMKAEKLVAESKIDDAAEIFKTLLDEEPYNVSVLNDLAILAIVKKSVYEAEDYLHRVLSVEPGNKIANDNLVYIKTLPEYVTAEPQSSQNSYDEKIKSEIAIYENQAVVHDLPDIHHVYSEHFIKPNLKKLTGKDNSDAWWVDEIEKLIERTNRRVKILSLGCGNGDAEIQLLKKVKYQDKIEFLGLDINPSMLDRARINACENEMQYAEFKLHDLNKLKLTEKYDVFIANHSLHHMVELEHIFDEMSRASGDDMIFLINDMIGRNGHMMWDNTKKIVDDLWHLMANKYKKNAYSGSFDKEIMNIDCSSEGFEGIRAEDILPLLNKFFDLDVYYPFGTVVNRFVDRAYGHNFNASDENDVNLIDKIIELDEKLLREGKLAPCQAFIKCVNKTASNAPKFLFQSPEESLKARYNNIKQADYIKEIEKITGRNIPREIQCINEEDSGKAHVAVISINDRCCLGGRVLSSLAKKHGHKISLIFFGEYDTQKLRSTCTLWENGGKNYHDELRILIDLLHELNPAVIGFTFRSISETIVRDLAVILKNEFPDKPILLGGIGATSNPNDCIEYADLLCEGEGDYMLPPFLDILAQEGTEDLTVFKHVPNLWIKINGKIIKNDKALLVEDLDTTPVIDYEAKDKYSIVGTKLLRNDGRYDNDLGAYPLLTSRGCPYSCSYCHNSQIKKLYKGQRYCRRRSVDHVINELANEKKRNPNLQMISVYDDSFPDKKGWLKEFAPKFKEKIDLPYWCFVHPEFVTDESIQLLVDSKGGNICMGCQSFSEKVLKLYNRLTPMKTIRRAFEVLKRYDIAVQIDLISFNPLETEEDKRATFRFLLNLDKNTEFNATHNKRWYLSISRLTLFPDTVLFDKIEKREKTTGEYRPYIENPKLEEFWEMMYRLTLHDYLPKDELEYLSDHFDEFVELYDKPTVDNGIEFIIRRMISNSDTEKFQKLNNELIRRLVKLEGSKSIMTAIESVEEFYRKHISSNQRDDINSIYEVMFAVSESLIETEQLGIANFILLFLLEHNYSQINVLNNLSVVYIMGKRYSEAINYINKVLSIDPANEVTLGNLEYLKELNPAVRQMI